MNGILSRSACRRGVRQRLALVRTTVLAVLLSAVLSPAARSESPAAPARQADISVLPITFPVQSPEVAAYFGEMALPQDIASVAPELLHLIPPGTAGQTMVAFRSWSEAESQLADLPESVDWIMYNPEHWELTPEGEQQNLAATVQQFAAASHERGKQFMFTPDRQFAELYLVEVAPYVDAVMLQGQRMQEDPETLALWVHGMAAIARPANPGLQIFVQVGATRGSASDMYTAIQAVAGDIDGIAVWSLPRTLDVLQEFVEMVRGTPPTMEATPPAGQELTPEAPAPTEIPETPAASTTASAEPGGGAAPTEEAGPVTPSPTQSTAASPTEQAAAPAATAPSPSPSAVTPAPPLAPAGQGLSGGGWVTDILLFVGGMGIGILIGFVFGWRVGRGP